jgi:hypothetical protein
MQKSILYLATVVLSLVTTVNEAESQSDAFNDFSAQRQKIIKQLKEASKNGIGIKPYESVLSSICSLYDSRTRQNQNSLATTSTANLAPYDSNL